LGLIGADAWADLFLSQMDLKYSINDLMNSIKGDLFISVSDVTMASSSKMPGQHPEKGDPMISGKILMGISLKDSATIGSLLAFGRSKMEEAGARFQVIAKEFPLTIKDGWLLGSTDAATTNNFGKSNIDHPFIRRIAGHPIGGFIDFQKLGSGFKTAELKGTEDAITKFIVDESMSTLQDILFYGGEIKDSIQTGHFEMNFVDKNTHSLKLLSDYLGKLKKLMMGDMSDDWEPNTQGASQPGLNKELLDQMGTIKADPNKVKIEEVRP
jgi:hypothetical protein